MVEVEDISLVPKSIICSYKAISDNVYRNFNVTLIPANLCLPVSQINEASYKLYEEEGGMGGSVEEAWSYTGLGPRQGATSTEAQKEAEAEGEAKMEEDAVARNRAEVQGESAAQLQAEQREGQQEAVVQVHAPEAAVSEGERERRRKGKGLLYPQAHGPTRAERILRPTYEHSGSDSFDPMEMGAQQWVRPGPMSSEDADSKAGPGVGPGPIREGSALGQGGEAQSEEEAESVGEREVNKEATKEELMMERVKEQEIIVDLKEGTEAEAGLVARRGAEANVLASDAQMEEHGARGKEGGDMETEALEGGEKKKAKEAIRERSRGSTGSVPPGFPRLHKLKSNSQGSSPFGKMQRGAFKHLKRTASTTSSGHKSGTPAPAKRTKPISELPSQVIAEVAANIGLKLPLNDEQIAYLKSLERERASP